jgi:hypothetical protein
MISMAIGRTRGLFIVFSSDEDRIRSIAPGCTVKRQGIQERIKKGAPAGAPWSERSRSSQINVNLSYKTLEIGL